jgi:hypothetical protein
MAEIAQRHVNVTDVELNDAVACLIRSVASDIPLALPVPN